MKIESLKVNAFTDKVDGGNPAGVVLNPNNLTPSQMTLITKKLKVSETAYFFDSKKADYKLLYYTPTVEVELCGHATIASFFTLGLKKIISKDATIKIETKAGILPIDLYFSNGDICKVMMTQAVPILKDINLDIGDIADSLNISKKDIVSSMPAQIVSSGLFTIPICVKSFEILKSIKADYSKVSKICKKYDTGSYFVYTFDTIEPQSKYHGRCFCPLYGVNEDPTTGTANGAVSYYLIKNEIVKDDTFIAEQGDIMGRPGRVLVEFQNNRVKVGGRAKFVKKQIIDI